MEKQRKKQIEKANKMTENVKTDELEKLENRKQPDAITKPIRPKTKNGMIVSEDEKIKEKTYK